MKLEDILIKINDYDDIINKVFINKDYITFPELINTIEDLYCEIDSLHDTISKLEYKIQEQNECIESRW